MREKRREGVGREVRKWGRFVLLILLSSSHAACFSLVVLRLVPSSRSRLAGRLVRRLVACLSSCGPYVFVPLFAQSFARRSRRLCFPSRPLVVSVSFVVSRVLVAGRGDCADWVCDGTRWAVR